MTPYDTLWHPMAYDVARVTRLALDDAASAVHRTVRAAELTAAADQLEAEAATWSLVWFLLGDGFVAERDGAAREAAAREVIMLRQR